MKRRSFGLILALLLATPVLRGEEARYLVVGGAVPVEAAGNGYSQIVHETADGDHEVLVATTLAPIGADGTYADVLADGRPSVPAGFSLPRRIETALEPALGAWESATLILEWVAENLVVDVGDEADQDAASVLERGRGRCSGLANATVALLQTAGFEARTVSGLLVGPDGPIPHRWIECQLPGAGWVASDPTLGLWVITPRHLVFADTVNDLPEVRSLAGSSDGLDRLPRRRGRIVRPNRGADLVCRFAGALPLSGAIAVLRGGGGEIRRTRFEPEARFSELLPGRWLLEVVVDEVVVERRQIDLREGDYRSYVVDGRDEERTGGPES